MRRMTKAEHIKDTKASARVGMRGNMAVVVVNDDVGDESVRMLYES